MTGAAGATAITCRKPGRCSRHCLFINDIVECKWSDIHGDNVLYADDMKLFSTNSIDLQNNLCTVESFLKNRQLSLASSKCVHLSIKHKCSSLFKITSILFPTMWFLHVQVLKI